ncbi:hypothetical protein [Phyllobacterium pellucidum]|uniref:hypothetical protein n=1 Tax=Phyllobacterium pellucidum TaxID=2740464 RepID=UPI001D1592B2|nr:hypothetical protein [Phyllobacterium sp. T1018]UGY08648.1 hypothetical protein LLE51_011425 [Phyllobacterium sp. T1018]
MSKAAITDDIPDAVDDLRKATEKLNPDAILHAADGLEILEGVGAALKVTVESLKERIAKVASRSESRHADLASDLQAASLEATAALKGAEQMRREVMSEVVILKRAVEGLRQEIDALRRSMYKK